MLFQCLDCCCSNPPFTYVMWMPSSSLIFNVTASEKPLIPGSMRSPVNTLKVNPVFSFLTLTTWSSLVQQIETHSSRDRTAFALVHLGCSNKIP